ncbi:unnamed protein product [Brassica oleracea]
MIPLTIAYFSKLYDFVSIYLYQGVKYFSQFFSFICFETSSAYYDWLSKKYAIKIHDPKGRLDHSKFYSISEISEFKKQIEISYKQ